MSLLWTLFSIVFMISIRSNISYVPPIRDDHYVAAVVEYVPVNLLSPANTLANLNRYTKIINSCKQSNVDIVVFPECGLVGCFCISREQAAKDVAVFVPSPNSNVIPCNDPKYSYVLSSLSCAALKNKIYVVVNLWEKVICFNSGGGNDDVCESRDDELLLFNTNIVFDRVGKIVARYRKFNLYTERIEFGLNSTRTPELSTFTTDFGITFGIIICFDILFKQPSYDLIHRKNVTDMIFSGTVFSQLPFLALTSLGAGWSYATNVTLLLADMPVKYGSIGGSGIYNGRSNPLKILVKEHFDTRIIIANVPKPTSRGSTTQKVFDFDYTTSNYQPDKNFDNSVFIVDSGLPIYTSHGLTEKYIGLLSNIPSHDTFTHTEKNFTCTVQISWTIQSDFRPIRSTYELLSFSGKRNFSIASVNNYVEACGLTLCTLHANGACRTPPHFQDSATVTINSINIFSISDVISSTVIPSTLDKNLRPLNVEYFTFDTRSVTLNGVSCLAVNMNLIKPVSGLITFGLYKLPEISNPPPDKKYHGLWK